MKGVLVEGGICFWPTCLKKAGEVRKIVLWGEGEKFSSIILDEGTESCFIFINLSENKIKLNNKDSNKDNVSEMEEII